MDTVDIAWVAGIVEGEGSIVATSGSSSELKVLMTDEDVVRRLHEVTGLGNVYGPIFHKAGGKPLYAWKVARKRDLARVLLAIYPLLGERRQQQIGIVADRLLRLRAKDERTCRKCGAEDWYIYPHHGRQCRPCANASSRKRRLATANA